VADGALGRAPRLVVVCRVTTRCTLSCGFCAYDRSLPFMRSDADESVVLGLGASLIQREGPAHLSLLGGEPFCWAPLPRVARELAASGLSLGITTNGVSLSGAAARELLLSCFDEVTVSIDGPGTTHDALRGWPGGFARLETALRELAGGRPRLRVNCVLMHENVRQLPELCESLAAWGVDELTFNRLGGRDRPEFFAVHRLQPADLLWLSRALPELQREFAPRGLAIRGTRGYVTRLLELEQGVSVSIDDCSPGERFVFVDERGTAAPCHFTLEQYGVPTDATTLGALPETFRRLRGCGRANACLDCQSTQVFQKFGADDGT
jgi:MoaA/NifB/PqqE/SkfB family radical SAM enzyme